VGKALNIFGKPFFINPVKKFIKNENAAPLVLSLP
jgi:hypothetical protein